MAKVQGGQRQRLGPAVAHRNYGPTDPIICPVRIAPRETLAADYVIRVLSPGQGRAWQGSWFWGLTLLLLAAPGAAGPVCVVTSYGTNCNYFVADSPMACV